MKNIVFRFFSTLGHTVWSWNTGGEGIHSPYLFYMVRMLLYDRNSYYCFPSIEKCRRDLCACNDIINVQDYGSRSKEAGTCYQRSISEIANTSLESSRIGQILFKWVLFLSQEKKSPLRIMELGTSFGITTAYLGSADKRNQVITLEGSPEIARIAKANWRSLQLENISLIEGNIDNTLYNIAREKIDVAYLDANHTEKATLRYFDYLSSMVDEKSIFIIDDIRYSPEMYRAWKQICKRCCVTTAMDLGQIGVVFFDAHYLRKIYRLRI